MNANVKSPPVDELNRIERMQAFFDELAVQADLGRMEFQDMWKKDWKDFRAFLHDEKFMLSEDRKDFMDSWKRIMDSFDAMSEATDKVDKEMDKVWDKQKPALDLRVTDLQKAVRETGEDFARIFTDAWDEFRNRPEGKEFRDEHAGAWEERMDVLKKKVVEFRKDFRDKLPDDDKVDLFRKEMTDSFDKMKKALHDLFA